MSDYRTNEIDRHTRRIEAWSTAAEREAAITVDPEQRQKLLDLARDNRATAKGVRACARQGRPDSALQHSRRAAGNLRWSLLRCVVVADSAT